MVWQRRGSVRADCVAVFESEVSLLGEMATMRAAGEQNASLLLVAQAQCSARYEKGFK